MKKIYLVCATGIATSTMLRLKVEDYLREHGMQAAVQQMRVTELHPDRIDADVIIATTSVPDSMRGRAQVVDGIPLITGVGANETLRRVLEILQASS